MAERTEGTSPADAGETGSDPGISIGAQVSFPIDPDGIGADSGPGGASGGAGGRNTGASGRSRGGGGARGGASRAQGPRDTEGTAGPSRLTFNVRRSVQDFSKLLQKKFGGQIAQVYDTKGPNGEPVQAVRNVDLWTLDKDETDILTNAIEGVRTRLPLMPEKWMLPLSAVWLGGVTLFLFSQRIAIYREIKAQALAQAQQFNQQQAATAGRQNGHQADPGAMAAAVVASTYTGEQVPIVTLEPDGTPPPGWDSLLYGGGA